MTIEMGILTALVVAIVAVLGFYAARMKDAEERGALKQRVVDLEKRQEKTDAKMDEMLKKLDDIKQSITRLFAERKVDGGCQS